jgi:hypothetical protein
MRNTHKIVMGNTEGKESLRKTKYKIGDNIKMDLTNLGCAGVDCIHLVADWVQWRTLLTTVMKRPRY